MSDQENLRLALARLATLEAELAEVRGIVDRLGSSSMTPPAVRAEAESPTSPRHATPEARIDRRRLLGRAGTAAVGAVLGGTAATIASASPAAAATGSFDAGPGQTAVTATGTGTGDTGAVALSASSEGELGTIMAWNSGTGAAISARSSGLYPTLSVESGPSIVAAYVDAATAGTALYAIGKDHGLLGEAVGPEGVGTAGRSSGGTAGVLGEGTDGADGVVGTSSEGIGVKGEGSFGLVGAGERFGLLAWGDEGQILMGAATNSLPRPTLHPREVEPGILYFDSFCTLWISAREAPGSWTRLGGAGTTGALTMLNAPTRVYDTRPGSGLPGAGTGPVVGVRHGIDLTDISGETPDDPGALIGVPADATAALVTLTVTNTIANPNAYGQIYADGLETPPGTSTINWTQADTVTATTTTTALTAGKVAITMQPGADVLIDVLGYYR